MNITLLTIGKTTTPYLETGIREYLSRLVHVTDLTIVELPDLKQKASMTPELQRTKEGEMILERYASAKYFFVLLDEGGQTYSSRSFATWLEKRFAGGQDLVFVVAGPYGASSAVKERANATVSLSSMTFTHEMVRLFFLEQLYRAFAIHKHLPYHHD